MENNLNKIILDINLKKVLDVEDGQNVGQNNASQRPNRWAQIKTKVGCTDAPKLGSLAQKLINTDLISENKLRMLKNDYHQKDPVAYMEGRQEEARKKHNRGDSSFNVDIMSEAKKIVRQERLQELLRRRQISIVDKELSSFKKELNAHKNVLTKCSKKSARPCIDNVPWHDSEYWADLPEPGKCKSIKSVAPKIVSTNGRPRPSKNTKVKNVIFGDIIVIDDDNTKPKIENHSDDREPKILEVLDATVENIINPDEKEQNINDETDEINVVTDCEQSIINEDIEDKNRSECTSDNQSFSGVGTDIVQSMPEESFSQIIIQEIISNEQDNDLENSSKSANSITNEIIVKMGDADTKDGTESLVINCVSLKPLRELCVSSSANIEQEPRKEILDFSQKMKIKLKKEAFARWKNYCSRKTAEDEQKKKSVAEGDKEESMTERIDSFLKKVQERKTMLKQFSKSTEGLKTADFDLLCTKKKKSASAPLQARYQHRFVAQQNVIAQQKSQILEQERTIQQLRAKRLAAEARESVQQACSDYLEAVRCNTKENAMFDDRRRMRPAAANVCLKMEVDKMISKDNPSPEVDSNTGLRLVSQPAPAFLQAMDQRAQQRLMRHQAAQERRKQKEEELRLAKEREELAKLEEDREEKLFRIAERKRKREEEKEKQRCLEQERSRIRILEQIADQHVRRVLLQRYGMQPFKRLIEIRYYDLLRAKDHYRRNLLRTSLKIWHNKTQDSIEQKLHKADFFNNLRLMRIYYSEWFKYHMEIRSNMLVAEDWYNLRIMERMVREWNRTAKQLVIDRDKKCYIAQLHYERQLKWRSMDKWRLLPSFNEIARQREKRKAKWRNKVWEILPDYKPITED